MASSSAMPNQIRIENTTAAIEWEVGDTTHSLATPDPTNKTIHFKLRLDSTPNQGQRRALLEVKVPVRFKDKGPEASIYLRLNPLFITSFTFTTKTEPSDPIKTTFNSAIICLDFQLEKTIDVLAPTFVKMPVTAVRGRSGVVLDALRELSCSHSMRIYIRDDSITASHLSLLKDAISQRTLQPLSGPDYDIRRMFSGAGAQVVDLSYSPPPPSYDDAAAPPLPAAPLYERKRPRQDSDGDRNGSSQQMSTRLSRLESTMTAYFEKLRTESENAALADELRTENTGLRERVALLENNYENLQKKCDNLERDMASLEQAYKDRDDEEDTELISIRDDIDTLEHKTNWIERGKDDETFAAKIKKEVLDELAALISGG
ncbi:hypothetical protein ACHAO7_011853 [Fusarium culmorum]